MNIILKDINLPKDTFGVKLEFQCYSETNDTFGTMIISHTEEQYVMFDDIIQIPKGARLIDANKLEIRRCDDSASRATFDYVDELDLEDVPTLLESEEEE